MRALLWQLVARRLRARLPADRVEPILVDLVEDYETRCRAAGSLRSAIWLLQEARSLEVAYTKHDANARAAPARPAHHTTLETIWQDTRIGARSLARSPALTAAITLTLAVGIGANTAIFAIVNGVLLQPLPYPDADRLVSVVHRAQGSSTDIPSAPYLYLTYRDTARTIDLVGLWVPGVLTVTGFDRPEQVPAIAVTHEVPLLLGVTPHAGRVFTAADDEPNGPLTAMVSWGYWQRRFGGDDSAIGRAMTVNGMRATVIGVLPRSFTFLDRPVDIMFPLQLNPSTVTLGRYIFPSLARLKPGVTLDAAAADLAGIVPRAIDRFPPPPGYTRDRFAAKPVIPRLIPGKDEVVGEASRALWILMGALAVVLIIACANVAHLLLVRADGRRRELAVRAALGASPARIVGSLLIEGVVLGVVGGAAGIALAYASLRAVLTFGAQNLPRVQEIAIDPIVLAFALAISLGCGIWLGLLPVFKLMRRAENLAPALSDGGRSVSDGRDRQRTRSVLVVVQVALALVLLVCSGLMIRTFQAMTRVEPGFSHPESVQLVYITATQGDADQTLRTQRAIVDGLASIPGVTTVGFSDLAPLGPDNSGSDTVLTIEGAKPVPGQPRPLRRFQFISPDYFRTLGTPVIAGRDLDWADLEERRQVAIVSATLARQEWGSTAAALGKRVQVTPADPWREVVGVAGDLRDNGMHEPAPPVVYFPARVDRFWGAPAIAFGQATFAMRSSRAGTESLLRDIESAVSRVNSDVPVAQARVLAEVYRASLARTSFTLTMLLIAGAMGLLLGVIGIYGVVAYGVAQRTREIGIRLALGARPGEVTRMFLRRGVVLALIGGAAGLAAASALTRLMSSLLLEVRPLDPMTYAAVTTVVLTVVTAAAYFAARRAARGATIDALR